MSRVQKTQTDLKTSHRMENSGKRRNTKTKFINSLQMRCSRFRERCTMVSWAERSDGKSSNQTRADILARLSPAQMAARSGLGTSRGTAPGSLDHLGNTIAIPTGRDRPPPYIAANVPRRAQAAVPILVNDNSRPGRTRVLPSSNNPSQQTRRFVPSAASSSRRSNIIQTSRKDDLFEDDVLGNDLVGEDLLGNACGGKAQDSDQSPYMKHHEEHEAQSTKRARDADETEDESDEIHGPPRKRTKRSSPTARKGTKAVLSPAIEGPFIQRVIEQQRQNPPPSLNNDLGNSDTEAWASDPNATMNLAPVATKSRPRTFRSGPSAVAALHADRARRPVPRATIGQTLNHPADYPGLSFEMGHYWTGPQRLQNTDSRSQRSSHSAAATSISQRIIVERATSQEFNNSAHTPPPPENTQCHTATAHPSESYTAAYLESSYGFADWPNPLLSTLDPLLLLPATASTTTTNIPTYDPSLDEIYFPDPSPATTATIDHQSPNPQRTSHDIFFPPMPVDDVLLRHDLPALSREDWESIEWAINWGGGGG